MRGAPVVTCAIGGMLLATSVAVARQPKIEFDMIPSVGAQSCLPNATAHVIVQSHGSVDVMNVKASGLPPRTAFDLFVLQVPKSPFGLSWYEGDFTTNGRGKAGGVAPST